VAELGEFKGLCTLETVYQA